MADWQTHLYCANKVNEVLGMKGDDLTLFLYGNLLPDINPGWNIEPKVQMPQYVSHFDDGTYGPDYFWEAQRFFEKYKEEIRAGKPLYLGYLFHLWLDVKIQTDFMSRVPMSYMLMRGYEVREWKWKDMAVFIKKYPAMLTCEKPEMIVKAAEGISEIDICEEDLLKIPGFLELQAKDEVPYEYHIMDEASFIEFFDKLCRDFTDWVGSFT